MNQLGKSSQSLRQTYLRMFPQRFEYPLIFLVKMKRTSALTKDRPGERQMVEDLVVALALRLIETVIRAPNAIPS